ncbi:MAG: hypothetical protein LBR37_01860 [Erysipelotrichaceae bacterium]|jgi:4-hydroxy-3-methylbut-2-enyl diphosphate reductase|nr:hypothetical protein [Erysipelotrichaceae bacterium]
MIIEIIAPSGFCYGLKRAIELLKQKHAEGSSLYYLYPLLNNEKELQKIIDEFSLIKLPRIEAARDIKNGLVIFPAHGAKHDDVAFLKKHQIKFFELTCPFVANNYQRLLKETRKKYFLGKKDHMETKVAMSFGPDIIPLYLDVSHVGSLDGKNAIIYLQTTLNKEEVDDFVKKHFDTPPEISYVSICPEPERRIKEALEASSRNDLILVLGSKSSSNANKLLSSLKEKRHALLLSSEDELKFLPLRKYSRILLTSGTSTSEAEINEVNRKLEALVD